MVETHEPDRGFLNCRYGMDFINMDYDQLLTWGLISWLTPALSERVCRHAFRATGIAAYRKAGGALENAQAIAAHDQTRQPRRRRRGWTCFLETPPLY
jgi:hypothetical protein